MNSNRTSRILTLAIAGTLLFAAWNASAQSWHLGPMSARQASAVDGSEAARRLKEAQRERADGAWALRAEQRGLVPGTVSHAYWQRQENLRRKVEHAQRRVNEVQRRGAAQPHIVFHRTQ